MRACLYWFACCLAFFHCGGPGRALLDSDAVVCLVALANGHGPIAQGAIALGGWDIVIFCGGPICLALLRRLQLGLAALPVLPLGLALAIKALFSLNSAFKLLNFRRGLIWGLDADGRTMVLN